VHKESRHEPFLFQKSVDSHWSLTTAGKEYVNENLSEELEEIKNPKTAAADVSGFYEFVTFHQSFAYEESSASLDCKIRFACRKINSLLTK
jgi:hypothetical protein